MYKSPEYQIDYLQQEIEEIRKYQSDHPLYNCKTETEMDEYIQGLLKYGKGQPSNLRLPQNPFQSLDREEIKSIESQLLEYAEIKDKGFPFWTAGPLYIICVTIMFQYFYPMNHSVLFSLMIAFGMGAGLMVVPFVLLVLSYSPLFENSVIDHKLRVADISKERMEKYKSYQNSLSCFYNDLVNHLIKIKYDEILMIKNDLLQVQRKKEEFWITMDGHKFERELENLLSSLGHNVERTKGSGDMGVDLILNTDTIIQCKATQSAVSPSVARDLLGTMTHFKKDKGILISTGGFTSGTVEFCQDHDIELWDLRKIIEIAESTGNISHPSMR